MQHPMEGLANASDWRYEPERMALREACLSLLLREFGSDLNENGTPVQPTMNIYDCAHDWVSQGNKYADGIVEYFKKHYDINR